jgi:ABC-2 type transport system permease protein
MTAMGGLARYLRLFVGLARYSLARELAFRGNFLARVSVELLWLFILLAFYRTIFQNLGQNTDRTAHVAGWTEPQYLFFVGCNYFIAGFIETFFLENCNAFADLVRNGDLDFYLLQPIDEQFLVSCRNIDWATMPNLFLGALLMVGALFWQGWDFDLLRLILFVLTVLAGIAISYSFLLLLTSTSVWMVRNQSLYELWWLFTSLMRYPREIFVGTPGSGPRPPAWAPPLGMVFTYLLPVMVVVNVPAQTMLKVLDPLVVAFMVAAAVVLLWLSRRFFRHALRRYRSASS